MRLLVKLLLPIFISLPLCGYNFASNDVPDLYLTSNTIGPLSAYQDNVNLNVVVHSKQKTRTFIDVFRCGPSKDDIRYSKRGNYRYVYNYTYELTFNIPTQDYLSNDGMYCEIRINNNDNTLAANFEFALKPIVTNKTINAADYVKKYFVVRDVSYHFEMSGMISESEIISFPDYLSYLNIDTYYKLTLNSVLFYTNSDLIEWSNAYLLIPDYQNIFPYITHAFVNSIIVPIKVVENEGECTFAFKNQMYVRQKDLKMSLLPKDDFVITNNFYFPVNEKEKILDKKIQIHLFGFGKGKTNITWSLEYLASENLIGKCETSQYCVVGEEV